MSVHEQNIFLSDLNVVVAEHLIEENLILNLAPVNLGYLECGHLTYPSDVDTYRLGSRDIGGVFIKLSEVVGVKDVAG